MRSDEVWAIDAWVSVGPNICSYSTNPVGNFQVVGTCVGGPGSWSWRYRIHYTAEQFHEFWDSAEGWSPEKTVAC